MAATLELIIKATDAASAVIGDIDKATDKLQSRLRTGIAVGAGAAAAAVTGFGVASVKAAADFEHALDQVGAVANATQEEMDLLSQKALQLGKDTMFGATDAAAAMEILAANGVSVHDILSGAADAAVALAAAGGTDLATAADTASTAMSIWGLSGEDMIDVVNRLAGAANVSRFGVEDMALAIAQGGGAAKTAGVEFADFAAAVAAIAPSFSSGADAGTSLKTFLTRLVPASDAAAAAMKDLGIITADGSNRFFDAAGNLKSMAEITGILHEATAGLSEAQKTAALNTIFGSDALRAAAALAGLTAEEFAGLSQAMGDTSAQDVAAQRMSNFKGSLEGLKGTIETLQIQIGMALLPALTSIADWLSTEGIPGFQAFAEGTIKPFVESRIVPELTAAFAQLQQTLSAVLQFLREHPAAIAAVAAGLAVLLAALFPIPTAMAAVITAGTLLLAHWDDIRNKVDELVTKFQTDYPAIWTVVEFVWNDIENKVTTAINAVQAVIQIVTALIQGDWEGAWTGVKDLVSTIWDGIVTDIGLKIGLLKDLMAGGLQAFAGVITDSLASIAGEAAKIPGAVVSGIGDLAGLLYGVGEAALRALMRGAQAGLDAGIHTIEDMPGRITNIVDDIVDKAGGIGWDFLAGLWGGIKARATQLFADLARLAKDILGAIKDPLGIFSPSTEMEDVGENLIQGLMGGLEARREALTKQLDEITAQIAYTLDPEQQRYLETVRWKLVAQIQEILAQMDAAMAGHEVPPIGGEAGGGAGGGFPGLPPLGEKPGEPVKLPAPSLRGQAGSAVRVAEILSAFAAEGAMGARLLEFLPKHGLPFDRGGWLMPGMTLAVNNTGRPERVLPPGSGGVVNIHVRIDALDGASVRRIAPELVSAISREMRRELA